MGLYIETGGNKGKAQWLVENHDAVRLDRAPAWREIPDGKTAVCVVDNRMFEAAGVCFSRQELHRFREAAEDGRGQTWLFVDKKQVEKLTGFQSKYWGK